MRCKTYLAGTSSSLLDGLDDTDGDGLAHVTDGEAAQGRVVGESLNAHGLGGNQLDDGRVTRLDELGGVLNRLAGTAVNLLEDLGELARNVGSVAIEDGGVASTDLTGVVEDNDLGVEGSSAGSGVVLGVRGDVATADVLDGDVLHVETNVVTGKTLSELLVVHLDGLDFSGDVGGGEGDDHAGLEDTSLDTADGHSSNTADLVDILEGKTEGLVEGTLGGLNGVDGLEEGLASGLASLGLLLPSLVPGAVGGGRQHVVAVETGDGDEGDGLGVVADLLDEVGGLLDNLVVTLLGPLGSVHLVDGNNDLADTKGVGEQGVLTGLAILGDTSLELTSTGSNDEDSAIGLGSTSDHVLDEITVTGSICMAVRRVRRWAMLLISRHLPMTVTWYLGVSNFQRAISMVIPRSRSALSLSRTQAYLKEPLPSSAASYNSVQSATVLSENSECDVFFSVRGTRARSHCYWQVAGYHQPHQQQIRPQKNFRTREGQSQRGLLKRGAKMAKMGAKMVEKKRLMLTFSNFSMVRLSIPPHW